MEQQRQVRVMLSHIAKYYAGQAAAQAKLRKPAKFLAWITDVSPESPLRRASRGEENAALPAALVRPAAAHEADLAVGLEDAGGDPVRRAADADGGTRIADGDVVHRQLVQPRRQVRLLHPDQPIHGVDLDAKARLQHQEHRPARPRLRRTG